MCKNSLIIAKYQIFLNIKLKNVYFPHQKFYKKAIFDENTTHFYVVNAIVTKRKQVLQD